MRQVACNYHEIYHEMLNIDIEQIVVKCLTSSILVYPEVTLIIMKYIVNLKYWKNMVMNCLTTTRISVYQDYYIWFIIYWRFLQIQEKDCCKCRCFIKLLWNFAKYIRHDIIHAILWYMQYYVRQFWKKGSLQYFGQCHRYHYQYLHWRRVPCHEAFCQYIEMHSFEMWRV